LFSYNYCFRRLRIFWIEKTKTNEFENQKNLSETQSNMKFDKTP